MPASGCLVACVEALASDVGPVRFPVHPRTQQRLVTAGACGLR